MIDSFSTVKLSVLNQIEKVQTSPVRKCSCKMTFNVSVHYWLKVVKLAVLQQIYYVNLNVREKGNKNNTFFFCFTWLLASVKHDHKMKLTKQSNTFDPYFWEFSSKIPNKVSSVSWRNFWERISVLLTRCFCDIEIHYFLCII